MADAESRKKSKKLCDKKLVSAHIKESRGIIADGENQTVP